MDVREKTANDKRLIDANAFLEKMKRTSRYFDVVFDVEEMPTVDAVEVVRCCECKWWHEDDDVGYCDNPDGLDNYAKPDEFCSYGERKEGAE